MTRECRRAVAGDEIGGIDQILHPDRDAAQRARTRSRRCGQDREGFQLSVAPAGLAPAGGEMLVRVQVARGDRDRRVDDPDERCIVGHATTYEKADGAQGRTDRTQLQPSPISGRNGLRPVGGGPPTRASCTIGALLPSESGVLVANQSRDDANQIVFRALCAARPELIGVAPAETVIPGMRKQLVLHAGPPIAWADMTPAMQAAIDGALVFEGLAPDLAEARRLAAAGTLEFAPAHDHQAAGAMAGIITASMPVFVVEDPVSGQRAYTTINEGLGKALRFGANSPDVLSRLAWLRDSFAPLLDRAIRLNGPMDLRAMVAEALRRGDEAHNRNKAGTAQFFRDIAPSLVATGAPHAEIEAAMRFIAGNDHFFLSLSVAHAKAVALGMEQVGGGSLVTTMAGNGRDVGIRVSGTGRRWFTAPAIAADVRLFPGHTIEEATPTMGDSYVTEVIGLGGFALAAAPAIVEFIGGTVSDLIERSGRMRAITVGQHPLFRIPALGFQGVPSGIDVFRVLATGITPVVNTGVASRVPGAGQIGAGMQSLPLGCFQAAGAALGDAVVEKPLRPEPG